MARSRWTGGALRLRSSTGKGNHQNGSQLLGRTGLRKPALQVADFWEQRGIYVLYDDYGPHYVGLARLQAIGKRLRQHTKDTHRDSWDRFSWFGFKRVQKGKDGQGLQNLGQMPTSLLSGSDDMIGDVEALLMLSLGTVRRGNKQTMKFKNAAQWEQVPLDACERFLQLVS